MSLCSHKNCGSSARRRCGTLRFLLRITYKVCEVFFVVVVVFKHTEKRKIYIYIYIFKKAGPRFPPFSSRRPAGSLYHSLRPILAARPPSLYPTLSLFALSVPSFFFAGSERHSHERCADSQQQQRQQPDIMHHHSLKSCFLKTQTFFFSPPSSLPTSLYCRYTHAHCLYCSRVSRASVISCRLHGHMNSLHSAGLKGADCCGFETKTSTGRLKTYHM